MTSEGLLVRSGLGWGSAAGSAGVGVVPVVAGGGVPGTISGTIAMKGCDLPHEEIQQLSGGMGGLARGVR